MKRMFIFIVALIALFPSSVFAQCTTPSRLLSYDTVVAGAGNDIYTFIVPKFDATLGDLKEVHLTSEITISYSFSVENKDIKPVSNVRVKVVREDEASSTDIETPFSNIFTKSSNNFALGAQDEIPDGGADYYSNGPMFIMNKTVLDRVSYEVSAFMGTGDLELTYLSSTYGVVYGSSFNNFSQRTNDEMRFTVSYLYCPKSVLDENFKTFNVIKKDDKAQISWTTANDHHRQYEVQVSTDGKTYSTIYKANSHADGNGVGSYLYNHSIPEDASGKLLFRVKLSNNDGTFHYSAVKVIELAKKRVSGLRIFPNPAHDEVQLVFDNSKRGNWKVYVISSTGQALKEYSFNNALMGRLVLQGMFPKGTYFLKAINTTTQETQATRLIIQ